MLSVVIPSYKDPLLHKTIDSLLENAQGEIEIIAVLDGYWPETPIKSDERIKVLHLGKHRGMGGAINAGVSIAQGEYIMCTDEHCIFGKGYDVILTRDCQPNWIVTARRYFLDPVKWEIMKIPPVDYEKLKVRDLGDGLKKFEGVVWKSRAKERKNIKIDETMAMQGSMWVMPKKWWEETIVELDTGHYGTMYQSSHDMVLKTLQKGGKLMVNKNTWFAHKHVSLPRTHRHGNAEETVSVIIPSREERFLNRTIREIREKFRGNYEIIVTLDGSWAEPVEGVKYIYNKEAKGMRTAINQAVAEAHGKYLMKLDAHCMLDEGIDEKLKAVHQDNWVQTPRRKRFNANEWKLVDTDQPDIDYMIIYKFKGHKDNEKNRDPELKKKLIDDTEVFQGSCYFMTKDYFNRLNLLDDKNFGMMGSEAIEIALKCRHDGGRIIINKTTWYAHAHIGALYAGGSREREKSREYVKILAKQL